MQQQDTDTIKLMNDQAGEWHDRVERLTQERDAAIARAEAAETTSKVKVTKASTPARPRKLGAVDGFVTDDKGTAADKLRAAIADADEVQIAFSDGTREVRAIDPIDVEGDAWRAHQFGTVLREPVDIEGPRDGSSVSIDGYALILDGKQVAYARRSTPLQVAPGQRVQLRDDIIF